MHQWKNDFLNLENELLGTRKKLNDLIYEYQNRGQNAQNDAIYQDKLHYLEIELQYINNQLQLLKNAQKEGTQTRASANTDTRTVPPETVTVQHVQTPVMNLKTQNPQTTETPYPAVSYTNAGMNTASAAPARKPRSTQDYEKLFGKNLMGIFASVLIFISLIIFATLILPHLTDTLKMLAMYIVSAAVLAAGLVFHRKNKDNLFYIAIIGCGAGSLYLSLLLSNLYFKAIGDLALYGLILLWAVFVKYLTKIKNLVFTIIGQAGILIASVLGTALCVHDDDYRKYFVLSIFYFISAVVFSNIGRNYLLSIFRSGNGETVGMGNAAPSGSMLPSYESNLCTHICKTLNVIVYTTGFALLTDSVYVHSHALETNPASLSIPVLNIFLFMGYLLLEFFFSYKENCKHGLAFQILSMVNAVLLVFLFNSLGFFEEKQTFAFMYLIAIAALFYVEKKNAGYKIFSQIWCLSMLLLACTNNPLLEEHLYIYLTAIPFMLVGYYKKDNLYLYASVVYLILFPFIVSGNFSGHPEEFVMFAAIYAAFLYVSRKTNQTGFKIAGYIALILSTWVFVDTASLQLMRQYNKNPLHLDAIVYTSTKAKLLTFFILAIIHLVLNQLEYFGKEKRTERVMLGINALLMFAGCLLMNVIDETAWKLPVILITILLFFANSKKLLPRHKFAGYYIAFKYTLLMLCILGSYDVVDYATSICLLVFAIISIVSGFYKNTIAFRLYGLVLSMISIVKLIMIDIKYDSTIENAVSFFVSGVLCFVISFIYNRIDSRLRGK